MGLSVDPGSASGGAIACREDGSLGQGHAEKMLHFSLPPSSSLQDRGVILFGVD